MQVGHDELGHDSNRQHDRFNGLGATAARGAGGRAVAVCAPPGFRALTRLADNHCRGARGAERQHGNDDGQQEPAHGPILLSGFWLNWQRLLSNARCSLILLSVTAKVRAIGGFTILLFVTELVSLPCGTACHQARAEHAGAEARDASSEHACHEVPVTGDLQQVAAIPTACTHQHDAPDSPRSSAPGDRDQHAASVPVIALLASHTDFVHSDVSLSRPVRDSISSAARLPLSLRI